MMNLFSHAELPYDCAVAVSLVGPFRVRLGQLAENEVASDITLPVGEDVILGLGTATAHRSADGQLTVHTAQGVRSYSPQEVDELAGAGRKLVRRWSAELTYPIHYVGASYHLAQGQPARTLVDRSWQHHNLFKTVLCNDAEFAELGRALMHWEVHRACGVTVKAPSGSAQVNEQVTFQIGPLRAPCAIIDASITEREISLVYGTLPGHVENGEQALVLTRDGEGLVTGRVASFSRHAWAPARMFAPVSSRVQEAIRRRYLTALLTPAEHQH
ncbi:DUF1990 domain-containing protein [Corynebacterium choanae]|nr:DUF1990 domain-containing protein [Corynebacterium choanae]